MAVSALNKLSERTYRLEVSSVQSDMGLNTVVGFVCPEKGFCHALIKYDGEWVLSQQEPDVYLPVKMERVLKTDRRFVIIIGGRGSGKSVSVADVCLIDAKDNGAKTYCLREYQSSIKNSVHSLLKEERKRLDFDGFEIQTTSILHNGVEAFQFAGLARNVDSIKSAHGFKRYWTEEAQFISDDSLTALTPTARKKPKKGMPGDTEIIEDDSNVSMIFVANPASSEDPFSKRFINPFKDELDKHGFYEDDLHCVVVMNYTDNPWYKESGLEDERLWDLEHRPRALYDHIWKGDFNDSVEDALIMSEWFDACVDAHINLGFKPTGVKLATHDPSDTGADSKGYAMRHGSVVLDVQEKTDGNVNEGGHWATGLAIAQGVDCFTWDCDGMGCALNEQVSNSLEGKHTNIIMFKGSESPDFEESIYNPALKAPVAQQRTIKDTFRNKRAQYYFELRDRAYRTYRAVVHGDYCDPDKMISFSSDIKSLSKLKSELCRMPVKPNGNGLFELYTKVEMKNKFKMASPNLGDSVMMLMRYVPVHRKQTVIPRPLKRIGAR